MEISLLVKTGSGFMGKSQAKYSMVTIPDSIMLWHLFRVASGGLILRTKTRDDISDAQFRFLLTHTVDMSLPADYCADKLPAYHSEWKVFGVCGSAVFAQAARKVGFVLGMKLGSTVVVWEDGTFTEIPKPEDIDTWDKLLSRLPSWDGSATMFH